MGAGTHDQNRGTDEAGGADYPPLIEASRQAADRIPGCELTVVPGMDHMPPLREPDLVLRTIGARWPGPAGDRGPPAARHTALTAIRRS